MRTVLIGNSLLLLLFPSFVILWDCGTCELRLAVQWPDVHSPSASMFTSEASDFGCLAISSKRCDRRSALADSAGPKTLALSL